MGEALEIFNDIDTDGSGTLSLEELSCRLSDEGFEDEEITDLFVLLDVDGDGCISQDEFVKGFQAYQDLMDDEPIVCVQEQSNVIRGVMNPHVVGRVQAASEAAAEGEAAAEEEQVAEEEAAEEAPASEPANSTFVIDETTVVEEDEEIEDDDDDEDWIVCVQKESSVIRGRMNPEAASYNPDAM